MVYLAACEIQRCARGMAGRHVARRVRQKMASVLIQSKYRGYKTRSENDLQGMYNARFSMEQILREEYILGESWLTAATPVGNPYCSCKLTRVRLRAGAAMIIQKFARGLSGRLSASHALATKRKKRRALIAKRWRVPLEMVKRSRKARLARGRIDEVRRCLRPLCSRCVRA